MKNSNENFETDNFSFDQAAQLPFLAKGFFEFLIGIDKKLNQIIDTTTAAPEKVYTVDEVADLLNVHPNTVRNYIKEGRIKIKRGLYPLRIPHSVIFDESNEIILYKYRKNEM